MKQTAVEWLINELDLDNNPWNMKIINKAKAMENEQLKEIYLKGIENYDPTFNK